ncbi:MAG: hypothetical protein ACI9V1_001464 [Spirosomataceae bacterium]|jgi:hypothetical protein
MGIKIFIFFFSPDTGKGPMDKFVADVVDDEHLLSALCGFPEVVLPYFR